MLKAHNSGVGHGTYSLHIETGLRDATLYFSQARCVMKKSNKSIAIGAILSLIILAIFALSSVSCSVIKGWQKVNKEADESVLRDRLKTIRYGIRLYAAEKQQLPQSLDDLYNWKTPRFIDPMTGQVDWQPVVGEDSNIIKGKRGIIDVHSKSEQISSKGTPYSKW